MTIEMHDILGTVGSVLIVGCYFLSQRKKLDPHGVSYFAGNALGAGAVLYSLTQDFNASAILIEAFWLVISAMGLWGAFRSSMRSSRTQGDADSRGPDR